MCWIKDICQAVQVVFSIRYDVGEAVFQVYEIL
jgi:hypothetical protein